jgi:membrane carboxypeptidase/penicillin-binding protein
VVPSTTLKQGLQLLATLHPVVQALARKTELEQRLQKTAQSIGLQWPITDIKELNEY